MNKELLSVIKQDALANRRNSIKSKFFGDELWKFIKTYRIYNYYHNNKTFYNYFIYMLYKYRFHNMSVKLSIELPLNKIKAGFSIAHPGNIILGNASVGRNCRVHEGVTIGATNGSNKYASIGNNVFISTGAKIIGDVTIADDVCIGANAVVVKDILEPGTTWGGVPAKKISNNNSHSNLSPLLNL